MNVSAISKCRVNIQVSQLRINMYYTYSPFYISQDTVYSDNFLGITDMVLTQKLPSAVVSIRSVGQ